MKAKTKLIATLMAMCLVITLGVFGILAVKTLNMSVGGNISFTADGVSFTIGQGKFYQSNKTTEYAGITTQTGKMQGFAMNTNTKLEDVEDEIASWAGLELALDSQGDAVLKFNIKNDMSDKQLYVMFTVSEGTNTNDNMEIICANSELIEPTDNKNIEITFDILDDSINAGLTGFKIDLNIGEPVEVNALTGAVTNQTSNKYTNVKYNIDSTKNTASISLQSLENVSGDVLILDRVFINRKEYIVTEIEEYAFNSNPSITSVVIPNTIETIGEAAFYDCNGISSITLGNGLKTIKYRAFESTSIQSIKIPKSVEKIEEAIFAYCTRLEKIILEPDIQGYIMQNNGLVEISTNTLLWGNEYTTIANGITRIGAYAFSNCLNLDYITLPNSLIEIGEGAFSDSGISEIELTKNITKLEPFAFCATKNLTNIFIPKNITSIGAGCFLYCDNLVEIYLESTTPPILCKSEEEEDLVEIFDNSQKLKIYIPNGSLQNYTSNALWSIYTELLYED